VTVPPVQNDELSCFVNGGKCTEQQNKTHVFCNNAVPRYKTAGRTEKYRVTKRASDTSARKIKPESSNSDNIIGVSCSVPINPLNAKLNPICPLLALLGAQHILHVSR